MLPLALNVTVTEETCSSVNITWTANNNKTANVTILYNSVVHNNSVHYTQNASENRTTNLTNLVADTEYTITVTTKYSDNSTSNDTVTAKTKSGTPSGIGTYVYTLHRSISNQDVHCTHYYLNHTNILDN